MWLQQRPSLFTMWEPALEKSHLEIQWVSSLLTRCDAGHHIDGWNHAHWSCSGSQYILGKKFDHVTQLCNFSWAQIILTHCDLMMPCNNIDLGQHCSGNGLLPDGTKPLPEPMLTCFQWSPVTFIWRLFHKRYLSYQSLKLAWKFLK